MLKDEQKLKLYGLLCCHLFVGEGKVEDFTKKERKIK